MITDQSLAVTVWPLGREVCALLLSLSHGLIAGHSRGCLHPSATRDPAEENFNANHTAWAPTWCLTRVPFFSAHTRKKKRLQSVKRLRRRHACYAGMLCGVAYPSVVRRSWCPAATERSVRLPGTLATLGLDLLSIRRTARKTAL